MSFSQEELDEFRAEASDLLDTAETSLLEIDGGADFHSLYDTIFRSLHNLKGASGMMELTDLQHHTHELENVLTKYKEASSLPKEIVGFFLKGIDVAKSILNGDSVTFDTTPPPTDATPTLIDKAPPTASKPTASAYTEDGLVLCETLAKDISTKILTLSQSLGEAMPATAFEPAIKDLQVLHEVASLNSFSAVVYLTDAVEKTLEKIKAGSEAVQPQIYDLLVKSTAALGHILNGVRAKSSDAEYMPVAVKASQLLIKALGEKPKTEKNTPAPKEHSAEAASSIRVPINLLDRLMTLTGEMVLVRNQVVQYASQTDDAAFVKISKQLCGVTGEIQNEMMKTRLQPIGNVLSKFNRVVRDLSSDLHKTIHLEITGSETELDKSLLEAIKDPLTHIVRNSCDHGIESPEIRTQAGKPATGKIDIKAYHAGGQVIIEVTDDGKGLDKEVLIAKAVEKGILPASKVSTITDKEAFNLIFAAGFSTAAAVTNVSGRGVGMDVVRTNIERIGGTIDLTSIHGYGTTIKLKIPLTLAIMPTLITKTKNEFFAIPQINLEELVRIDTSESKKQIEMLHGVPVYRLRENILPLVDLGEVLQVSKEHNQYRQRDINIAVLTSDGYRFGLIIDEILDTADIVVKPLNRLLKSIGAYAGATVLGDGNIALILDTQGLAKIAELRSEKINHQEQNSHGLANSRENQDFLLFETNSPTLHCVSLSYVHRLEEFSQEDIEYSGHERSVRYRGSILPLINANKILSYPEREKTKDTRVPVLVVLRGGRFFGIEVDRIIDTFSTLAEAQPLLKEQAGLFGSLIEQDRLITIADPFEMIRLAYPGLTQYTSEISQSVSKNTSSPKQILLVEDTPFFRRTIVGILEKSGHKVVFANDGAEALKVLDENPHRFDLVVSDIEMPNMNGFELAKNIRKNPIHQGLPLLAVSSSADKDHTDKGRAAGFNIYLEKLQTDDLLRAVHTLTEKEKAA